MNILWNALNSSAVTIFLWDQYQWENRCLLFMGCSQYSARIVYKCWFSSIRWIFWGTWLQVVVPKVMTGYFTVDSVAVSVVWEPGALSWIKGIESAHANLNSFSIALKQEQYKVLLLHWDCYFLFSFLAKEKWQQLYFSLKANITRFLQ